MLFDEGLIGVLCIVVIVPVNQLDPRRNLLCGLFWNFGFRVIPIWSVGTEKHVAPHHRGQSQTPDDFHDPFQVCDHDLPRRNRTVLVEILAVSQMPGFVHTDVDVSAGKILRQRHKKFIDKFVRLILVDEKNIIYVDNLAKTRQFRRTGKMRERLNARNQLNPVRFRVFV